MPAKVWSDRAVQQQREVNRDVRALTGQQPDGRVHQLLPTLVVAKADIAPGAAGECQFLEGELGTTLTEATDGFPIDMWNLASACVINTGDQCIAIRVMLGASGESGWVLQRCANSATTTTKSSTCGATTSGEMADQMNIELEVQAGALWASQTVANRDAIGNWLSGPTFFERTKPDGVDDVFSTLPAAADCLRWSTMGTIGTNPWGVGKFFYLQSGGVRQLDVNYIFAWTDGGTMRSQGLHVNISLDWDGLSEIEQTVTATVNGLGVLFTAADSALKVTPI